jgi:hypothetical protein
MEGTRVRNVVGTVLYSLLLAGAVIGTVGIWIVYFGAIGTAGSREIKFDPNVLLTLAIAVSVLFIPVSILTGFCLSLDKAQPWHYRALAVFFILSAISALLEGSFWGLGQSGVYIAGTVMPMDHWPTRYLRPISIRSSEGVLPQ